MKSDIIIADKSPMTRLGLNTYFENSQFNIISSLENGASAYSEIVKHKPDFAILEYNLPGITGLEVAQLCDKYNISTKIIIYTNLNSPKIYGEIGKTIQGYILKDDNEVLLLDAIEKIRNYNTYFSNNVIQTKRISSEVDLNDTLSIKELRILKLVSQGKSSQDISEQLHLSRRTIENQRSSMIKKLGIDSTQFGLIQWAKDNFETINE